MATKQVIENMFNKRISRTTGLQELAIPTINTEHKRSFISYIGVKMWRGIPGEIQVKPTIKQFHIDLFDYLCPL